MPRDTITVPVPSNQTVDLLSLALDEYRDGMVDNLFGSEDEAAEFLASATEADDWLTLVHRAARRYREQWQPPTLHSIPMPADGWLTCICGNDPRSEGLVPCNRLGHQVEPTDHNWPDPLYRCERCDRVIDTSMG